MVVKVSIRDKNEKNNPVNKFAMQLLSSVGNTKIKLKCKISGEKGRHFSPLIFCVFDNVKYTFVSLFIV